MSTLWRCFQKFLKDDVPDGAKILGGRFVLSIKNKDCFSELHKERYIVQGQKDIEKNILFYNSSVLKQNSIRLLLSLADIFGFRVWSRDVTQA